MQTPGTQKQTRAQQYKQAAKRMGVSLYKNEKKGLVDKSVLSTIKSMIGPPAKPKSNFLPGKLNAFGGQLDMTA